MAAGFPGQAGRPSFSFSDEAGSCLMVPSFPPRPRELAVRLDCGPCAEERAFLSRRKQVVAKALKQALQLDGDLQEDEVWGLGWIRWASSGSVLDAGTGCALTRPELVPSQPWTLLCFPLPCCCQELDHIKCRAVHEAWGIRSAWGIS